MLGLFPVVFHLVFGNVGLDGVGFRVGVLPEGVQFVYKVAVKASREMSEVVEVFLEVVEKGAEVLESVVLREVVQVYSLFPVLFSKDVDDQVFQQFPCQYEGGVVYSDTVTLVDVVNEVGVERTGGVVKIEELFGAKRRVQNSCFRIFIFQDFQGRIFFQCVSVGFSQGVDSLHYSEGFVFLFLGYLSEELGCVGLLVIVPVVPTGMEAVDIFQSVIDAELCSSHHPVISV